MSSTPHESAAPNRRRGGRWKLIALGALVIAIATGLTLPLRAKARVKAVAQSARSAVLDRRIADARKLIDEWAALSPRDGEPEYYRALLCVITEHPAEAMDAVRLANERGYPEEPLFILRAVLEAQAGMFANVEPLLRRGVETSSAPAPEIAEALARTYLMTFRMTEAARAIEHWMRVAPLDARPYIWRNKVSERLGSGTASRIYNSRVALQLDPTLDSARLALADLLRESSQVEEAAVEYAAYLKRNPNSHEGHDGAGQIALLAGDLVAAAKHFETALSLKPDDSIAIRETGLIRLRNGQFASARDLFKKAVDLAPFDPQLRYNYASALEKSGDKAGAERETQASHRLRADERHCEDLRQSLASRPGDANLRSEVARWLVEHGHEKEGLEWTELILREVPGHPPTCRLLAEYHAKHGNAGLANYYRITGNQSIESR